MDGGAIRAAEIERAAALPLYRLRGEIYRERQRNTEAAIEDRLLTQEARWRGASKQDLLAKVSRGVTVSDEEVQTFIEAERAAGRPVPTAARARPYLEFRKAYTRRQALLDRLRAAARIKSLLQEPALPRLPVMEAGAPGLGAQAEHLRAAGRFDAVAQPGTERVRVCGGSVRGAVRRQQKSQWQQE